MISAPGSAVRVRAMPTDEERTIATHTLRTLGERPLGGAPLSIRKTP